MDITELNDYCLAFPCTEATTPFNDRMIVYKVAGKIFAVTDIITPEYVTLKCDPEYVLELREKYSEIYGAPYFNKKHWNAVSLNGDLPASLIKSLIKHSFMLVIKGLTRQKREEILTEFEKRDL